MIIHCCSFLWESKILLWQGFNIFEIRVIKVKMKLNLHEESCKKSLAYFGVSIDERVTIPVVAHTLPNEWNGIRIATQAVVLEKT